MKHILLIHTGGTLGMVGTHETALRPDALGSTVHAFVPELRSIAEIDFEVLLNLDSSDFQPEDVEALARFIYERYARYDGFVIIHGTDTMVYTASALAFLLRGLAKPVILTGSQRPIAEVRSDAKPNLISACVLACEPPPIPEVAILFGTTLLRGCRAKKVRTVHFEAFESPNCPPLVRLGVDIARWEHIRAPGPGPQSPGALANGIFAFRLFPGLDPRLPVRLLDAGAKGIVLEAYGLGNVPIRGRPLAPFVAEAHRRGVPVVLTTQCPYGAVDPGLYEGGKAALDAGAIPTGDMTVEAAVMKLSVLLGQQCDLERVRSGFAESWVGERS